MDRSIKIAGGGTPLSRLRDAISASIVRIRGELNSRDARRVRLLGLALGLSSAPYLALGASRIAVDPTSQLGIMWGVGFVLVGLAHLAVGLAIFRAKPARFWPVTSHLAADRPGEMP